MHATTLVDSPTGVSAETPTLTTALARTRTAHHDAAADTHALGETIASLAAGIHVATYRLLVLLREFDERLGWNTGFLSCARWLHWRAGVDLGVLVSTSAPRGRRCGSRGRCPSCRASRGRWRVGSCRTPRCGR